jgi:hypothetical protein
MKKNVSKYEVTKDIREQLITMNDYWGKQAMVCLPWKHSWIVIMKEKLETEFCFGYSCIGQGGDYESASNSRNVAKSDEDYFREENMQKAYGLLDGLSRGKLAVFRMRGGMYGIREYEQDEEEVREMYNGKLDIFLYQMEDSFVEEVAGMIQAFAEKQSNRIDAYLKRYGLSKIKTWTYCSDD